MAALGRQDYTVMADMESLPEELLQLILSMVPMDPNLVSLHSTSRCTLARLCKMSR